MTLKEKCFLLIKLLKNQIRLTKKKNTFQFQANM